MEIYKISNVVDGKFYIGKTKHTAKVRWAAHQQDCKYSDTKFYRALKKHGFDSFVVETIEYARTEAELNELEKYWISTLHPDYNTAPGGTGGLIGTGQLGKTWTVKDTSNMKNKKTVTESVIEGRKRSMIGGANYQSKYFIHTPWGVFETWFDATTKAKELKLNGETCIVVSDGTLQKYCLNDVVLNTEGRRTPPPWRGKSTKALGFYVTLKDKHGKTKG